LFGVLLGLTFALFLLGIIVSVLVSGFFLWVALKIVGEDRGILEAGIANIVASFISIVAMVVTSLLILFAPISPLVAFFVYIYVLKSILNISFIKAIIVAIIACAVFLIVMTIAGIVLSISFPAYHIHHFGKLAF